MKPRLKHQLRLNLLNTKGLLAVQGIRHSSDGVNWHFSFRLIYQTMVIEVEQYLAISDYPKYPDPYEKYIGEIHHKAICSLKWWKRFFPTTLNISGLFIKCYIPEHRKNGY